MRISDWSSDVCSSDLADADREDHRAVRDALADILRRAPDGIHMMREEIAGMAGVNDEIGFGDRAPDNGARRDRKNVGQGKIVAARVDLVGRPLIQTKN